MPPPNLYSNLESIVVLFFGISKNVIFTCYRQKIKCIFHINLDSIIMTIQIYLLGGMYMLPEEVLTRHDVTFACSEGSSSEYPESR